jgi:multiple sugar transport system permease protein
MRAGYVRAPWWRRPDGRTLALRYVAAVIVTVFFLFPVYWLFAVSLKTPDEIFATPPVWLPGQFNLSTYYTLFRDGDARTVLNSMIVAGTSTVIAMLLGTIGGYSLARYRTGGDNLAVWIISQRMIPPIAIVFPIFLFFALIGWVDTFHGLILLYVAFNLPYVIWMMRGYFQDMPAELEESALIDGCTRWQALWKVTIPVARNGIFATAVFTFIFAWNDYIFALILTRTQVMTYTVQVMGYFGSQSTFWAKISAMSVLGTLPIFLAVATMQRYLVRGISMGAVKA